MTQKEPSPDPDSTDRRGQDGPEPARNESGARVVTFTDPRTVELRRRSLGSPGPEELEVEAICSAISAGTEGLLYRGEAPRGMEADTSLSSLQGSLSYPIAYGYALVGRVRRVGSAVDSAWQDRRVFAFHPHATRAHVPVEEAIPVPEGLSAEVAALLPTAETAVNLAHDAALLPGEDVLVLGLGPVGLLTTALLAKMPLVRLVTSDRYERRRRLSARWGAEAVVPAEEGSGGVRRARSRGRGASGEAGGGPDSDAGDPGSSERDSEEIDSDDQSGYDRVIECSGAPAALDTAIAVTAYDGRIVVGSWYGRKRADLDLGGRFHRSRIEIVSSQVSTVDPRLRGRWSKRRRLETAWGLLDTIEAPEALISHRIPVEEAARAYEILDEEPERALQILLTYA